MHPILVERLKGGVASLDTGEWRRRGWGHRCVFQGLVWQRWLIGNQRRGAIVLVVFRWVGISIVEFWLFQLVDTGEKHPWSCKFDNLALCNLVHFLQFTDMSVEVQRVGWDRG